MVEPGGGERVYENPPHLRLLEAHHVLHQDVGQLRQFAVLDDVAHAEERVGSIIGHVLEVPVAGERLARRRHENAVDRLEIFQPQLLDVVVHALRVGKVVLVRRVRVLVDVHSCDDSSRHRTF